jgi:hypothetical protein
MEIILLKKSHVVEWLRDSDFFHSMSQETQDEVYPIEKQFYKLTDEISNKEDLLYLLNTARWWGVNTVNTVNILKKYICKDKDIYRDVLNTLTETGDLIIKDELKYVYENQNFFLSCKSFDIVHSKLTKGYISITHEGTLTFYFSTFNIKEMLYPFHLISVLLRNIDMINNLDKYKCQKYISHAKSYMRFLGMREIEMKNNKITYEEYLFKLEKYKHERVISNQMIDIGKILLSKKDNVYKFNLNKFVQIIYDGKCVKIDDENGSQMCLQIINLTNYRKVSEEFEKVYLSLLNNFHLHV